MVNRKKFLFFLVFFLAPLSLFFKSFTAYFSQDDFFHLRASQGNLIQNFNYFFSFSSLRGYAFYRPLSREVYNNLMWHLFGLNPLPFHLVQYLIFLGNLFLLDKFLGGWFVKSLKIRILTIFLYAVSAVHLGTFYYLGSIQILLAMSFILLTLIFFQKKKYLLSYLFFCLALLCHEISYLTPSLLFMVSSKRSKKIKLITPFLILVLVFSCLNLYLIGLPKQEPYLPKFSLRGMINNLFWYGLWGIGVPEHLVDYVGPGLKINSRIILQYPIHFWLMVILVFLLTFSLAMKLISQKEEPLLYKKLFLSGCWFLVTCGIFLILPTHRFVY